MHTTQRPTAAAASSKKRTLVGAIMVILLVGIGGFLLLKNNVFIGHAAGTSEQNLLANGWDYVPGVTRETDGLHVHYVGEAIVQQDGSPGSPNPPVNLYGTHLAVGTDFTLTAQLKYIKDSATFRVYADTPAVLDEFRVDSNNLALNFAGGKVTATVWPAYSSTKSVYDLRPTATVTASYSSGPTATAVISQSKGQLSVTINNQKLAVTVPPKFFSRELWFGMSADTPSSSWTLGSLTASASQLQIVNTQQLPVDKVSDAQSLQALASHKRPGFVVGAAMALAPAVSDTTYRNLAFGGIFGQMTPENALKWQFIHPQPTIYDFAEADALVDMATKHNMKVHGHTLVFGEANPLWVQQLPTETDADKEKVKQIMLDHIAKTVGHFKGKVASWDVVNEPLEDQDDGTVTARDHIWYRAMGPDYIRLAFAAAHQADPAAKLYINDYGLEADDDRWVAMLALVKLLKSEGVPIDGVGFEAHVYETGDEIDPAILRSHIQDLAALGLKARISEMDVHHENGLPAQAKQYTDVLSACMSEPACVSWTTWGVTDKYDLFLDDNDKLARGEDFLWDVNGKPIPAFGALLKSLSP